MLLSQLFLEYALLNLLVLREFDFVHIRECAFCLKFLLLSYLVCFASDLLCVSLMLTSNELLSTHVTKGHRVLTSECEASKNKNAKYIRIEEENGVLVCKGRLENADLSLESKHPVFLPKEHRLTELIVRDCHERVFHSLVRATLAELGARFWVTKARQFVKKILHSCLLCRKLEGKPYCPPPTGQFPEYRVKKSDPFANVGIDFAGPLYVKVKKGAMKKGIHLFILLLCNSSLASRVGPRFVCAYIFELFEKILCQKRYTRHH